MESDVCFLIENIFKPWIIFNTQLSEANSLKKLLKKIMNTYLGIRNVK